MAHRVAPQVGQGTPVKRRNKQPGHGSPRLSQAKQLAANPDETVRKRNSKSVSFGASGRNVKPTLRLTRVSHDPVGNADGMSIRQPPDRGFPKAFEVRRCKMLPKLLATGDLLIRPGPDEKVRLSVRVRMRGNRDRDQGGICTKQNGAAKNYREQNADDRAPGFGLMHL